MMALVALAALARKSVRIRNSAPQRLKPRPPTEVQFPRGLRKGQKA
jgi:hypothetical protein